jgi:hypothetical protein
MVPFLTLETVDDRLVQIGWVDPIKINLEINCKKGNTTLLDIISIKRDARQINITLYGSNHIENWIYSSYLDKSIVNSF